MALQSAQHTLEHPELKYIETRCIIHLVHRRVTVLFKYCTALVWWDVGVDSIQQGSNQKSPNFHGPVV